MKGKFNLLVLGSGFMGRAIAKTLLNHKRVDEIGLFSNNKNQLNEAIKWINSKRIRPIFGDVRDRNFYKILKSFDLILGALPSSIGLTAMKKIIEAEKNMIDVSAIEEYLKLSKIAKKKKVKIIPECGISPGLMNFLIGYEITRFDQIENIEVKVGTLSENLFPVTWCPEDLVKEYFYPARVVEGGKIKKVKPLSGLREEILPKVGKVETFYLDGLGSLLETIRVKEASYRDIRPVGFAKFVKGHSFKDLKNIAFHNHEKLGKNITAMFIDIYGKIAGNYMKSCWQVFSRSQGKFNSMQRIVSSVATIFTQLLLEGKISSHGILLMEDLGKNPFLVKRTLTDLKKRGIKVYHYLF